MCLICDVSDEWARQEKLDEILDYLRGVGSSGKKVEARFGSWANWSRLCRSNSKHTCGAFWRVYVLFLQALENRLDEAGHEKNGKYVQFTSVYVCNSFCKTLT